MVQCVTGFLLMPAFSPWRIKILRSPDAPHSAGNAFAGVPIEVPGIEIRQRISVGKLGVNYRF
jgi:hypothetical protein